MSGSRRIIGRWRITEMDNWDQEAVDLVGPGFIEFDEDGLGELGFIAVTGELDYRDAARDGRPGVEFSWQGSDEGDDVSGRGWAALNPDGTLEGHIYFHLGDDSAFRAERCAPASDRDAQARTAPERPPRGRPRGARECAGCGAESRRHNGDRGRARAVVHYCHGSLRGRPFVAAPPGPAT